ncbi:MAG TPA: hypothetical protein VJ397_10070 [Thermoplasmata archaeon]|nr:hypothetical protein [Thermoplasmata archaeon]
MAATVGPADRLWPRWLDFDGHQTKDRVLPRYAYEEFLETVEGSGPEPGMLERLFSDCTLLIRLSRPEYPATSAASQAGLTSERIARSTRLLETIAKELGRWDSDEALRALREQEAMFYQTKRGFLARHEVFAHADENAWRAFYERLQRLIPRGGMSWDWDCKIVAQAACFRVERKLDVQFVSEDKKHLQKHRVRILAITGLRGLVDLQCQWYAPL